MINLCGLWKAKKTDKHDNEILTGNLGGSSARLMVFVNPKKKEGDNRPDFNVCITEQESR